MMRVDEDENFSIDVDGDAVARVRVWKRPDLPFDKGAELARRMLATTRGLAGDARARGLVLDLREAPVLVGPRTRSTLAELVGAWEAAGKRVGVVLVPGVQRVTLEPGLTEAAPTCARVTGTTDEAHAWVLDGA